jgi:putative ABC transport system ATP-binding protein
MLRVINLDNLVKRYQMGDEALLALNHVSLNIEQNEYVAIVGSSGSGKSTLMNVLGCLDTPTAGDYHLNGKLVSGMDASELACIRNLDIGFIFQSFNLLPRSTALQNVMQPLIYRGTSLKERKIRAVKALESVGLGDRLDHMPNQLSGGQRQRVAVARALVTEPSILLADEPTGNLDSKTTKDMMALFDGLHATGQTIILVTHEDEIAAHCHRVIEMQDGQIISDVRREDKKEVA